MFQYVSYEVEDNIPSEVELERTPHALRVLPIHWIAKQ
jgi:hypothetical protein